ncbi:MAG: hypothetical protein J6K58_06135 [Lachnospiraceae bacterium]|nr:hypothetical protein [Lachnospiraceae bacterium]
MKSKKIEKAIKGIHPKLQILFLYGIFFVILGILDLILDCLRASGL